MNKSTKTVVIWESIVGGFLFLVLLILSIAKVFPFLYLFIGIAIILIVSGIVMAVVIVMKKKSAAEGEKDINAMDTEEARFIALEKLYDPSILEYEKELIYEKVGHFGIIGQEVPVYIRKLRGTFENNIIAILVNMKDKRTTFKFFDESKITLNEMDVDIEKEANLLVLRPSPPSRVRIVEEKSQLTGIEVKTTEPIETEEKKAEEAGDLT